MQTKTYPGADCASDHNPVVATIRIKLKKITRKKMTPRKDYELLKVDQALKGEYQKAVKEKYNKLKGCRKRLPDNPEQEKAEKRNRHEPNCDISMTNYILKKDDNEDCKKRQSEKSGEDRTEKRSKYESSNINNIMKRKADKEQIGNTEKKSISDPKVLTIPINYVNSQMTGQIPERDPVKRRYEEAVTTFAGEERKRRYVNTSNLKNTTMKETTPDEEWEILKEALTAAADEVIPKTETRAKNKWMTEEILELMDKRCEYKDVDDDKYKEINKVIKSKCRKAKEVWFNNQCQDIEKLKYRDTPTMYKKINMLAGKYRKRNNWAIKDKDGKLLIEEEETLNRWVEYAKELFKDNRGNKPELRRKLEGPKILKPEVVYAMKSMKANKSPGNDNIRIEMIQALEDFGIDTITSLANKIYDSGIIPEEMTKSIFITIPKAPKAVDCDKHRIISLMSQITKLILRILLNRAREKIKDKVADVQYGFKPGKGTRNAIFVVRMLTERAIEVRKDLYICFVDYEKAFDKIHHKEMIKILEEINLDSKDIRVITNLYWKNQAAFRVGQELSDWTEIHRGVRQGCVLSPDLFALYGEKIMANIEDDEGIIVGGRNINNIRYADDTVLIADSEEKLQKLLTKLSKVSEEKGLSINLSKTKILVASKKDDPPRCNITLNRNKTTSKIKQVNEFEYLGSLITSDGRSEKEIKRRIGIAKTSFNNMKSILTNRKLHVATRKRLIKTYIWSKMLYGCESWTISNSMKKRLEAAEMWMYRRTLRISWKDFKTNEDVLRIAKAEKELLSSIKARQMSFLGHIMRHSDTEKLALTGRMNGSRGRGRRRINFMDNFEELGETANEILKLTLDRDIWKKRKREIVNLRVKKPKILQ